MGKTYTITSEQVSQIHNAWCDLSDAYQQASSQFKEDSQIVRTLRRALDYIDPVRKDVVGRKDRDWDKQYAQANNISKIHGFKHSIWTIYEIDSFMDKSSVPVGSTLYSYYSGKHKVVVVEGPTWLDLWKATDQLIKSTAEEHGDHVFIENYIKTDTPGVYEISLGS